MDYKTLCETYLSLESTSKGLEKTKIISDFLDKIKEEPEIIYLLQGRIFPDNDPREIGISEQLVIKALSRASGVSEEKIVQDFKKIGDLGKVGELTIKKKEQNSLFLSKLTTQKILFNLRKFPSLEGKGTVDTKLNLIVELLHSASGIEARYVIRTLLGDLKVGVGSAIIRDAIINFCFAPESIEQKKKYQELVQVAYDKSNDFAEIFSISLNGLNGLNEIDLSPGKPVKVMLFPKAKDIPDAFKIVGKPAAFEFKYDGFRMMINKSLGGSISIFTRRLENVTKQFPDAVKYVTDNVNGDSFILDAEAVGFNPKTKKYMPFQDISQRIKRKYNIDKLEKELPIELNIFDIIYYNGNSLINEPFIKRRKLIEKIVKTINFKIRLSEQIITDSEEEAGNFYNRALEENQEGLMAKSLDAIYKPGARIGYAVKLKPDAQELDLVITGAEYGTGKRAGWLTSFDVSCRDEDGNLLDIGKVSTGLKEKEEEGLSFLEMTQKLKPLIIKTEGRHVYVSPVIVAVVGYQNVQKSPTYSSGYALRFPRFKLLRPDRSAIDIARLDEIAKEVE